MLSLLVSVALAASPTENTSPTPVATVSPEATTAITLSPQKKELNQPQTSKSLIEISAKLNSMLPEHEKIIIPSAGSRQFFSQLAVMKKSSANAKTAKAFLKLSDLSIQGCNAYSASGLTVANWNDADEVFKITNKQVRSSGNMKDAQALARVSLMVAQCKGPLLLNMMGAKWLEDSIETLKALNHRKLKKDDTMRLKALKEQVLTFDTKEALQNSLRYEVLISSAEVMKTLSEAPPAHSETAEDVFNNLLLVDKDGNPRQVSTEKAAEITMKILNAVQASKTYQFTEYTSEIDKQIKEGRDGIIEDLQLKDQGFTSYEKFQDEAFMDGFSKKLIQDGGLLKRVKKNIEEHPEINTHLFQHSLAIYKIQPEAFEKFQQSVLEAQKEVKGLLK